MTGSPLGEFALRLLIAAAGGLAVGIEREWSIKQGRHQPHFAGTRTFLLLGLVGALGAALVHDGLAAAGVGIMLAAAGLIVVAYALTSRRGDVGGTTEIAALIVLAAGALAGLGRLALASALFALTTLVLAEKTRLHTFVGRIRSQELTAAVRFAVLALVILPLLPAGPFGPPPGFRPRELWILVLVFSGLSFASYLALRFVGLHRGYALVGLLGGLISSTAVTLNFARESRRQLALSRVLGVGVLAACTVLPLRVVALTAVLSPSLGAAMVPYIAAPVVAGLLVVSLLLRRRDRREIRAALPTNPLRLGIALQMALVFQAVLYIMDWAAGRFGASGQLISAALVGLTDVDALTYSMIKLGTGTSAVPVAARALAAGCLSNTLFKLAVGLGVGRGSFRRVLAAGLGVLAVTMAAMLWLV
jgi:uncharacterized membrane protein (DUF4010 family)